MTDALDRLLCKRLRFREIQLRLLYDPELPGFAVVFNFTPFAVVVRLIGLDNGGFCFFQLFQAYCMQKPALRQLLSHLIERAIMPLFARP